MKRKVLKWNITIGDLDKRVIILSKDYDYDDYRTAFLFLMEHMKCPNTHKYSRSLHKVVRTEQVDFPGVGYLKKLAHKLFVE